MNVSYLESNKESLINHMKAAGYSVSYIKKCRSIETVLDELPARSFSIRNMAGFPYHIIFSAAWKSNHIADTKEVIAEIIDNRLNRVFVGVNMQDVFISSDLCYQMSASPVPLMLGGV